MALLASNPTHHRPEQGWAVKVAPCPECAEVGATAADPYTCPNCGALTCADCYEDNHRKGWGFECKPAGGLNEEQRVELARIRERLYVYDTAYLGDDREWLYKLVEQLLRTTPPTGDPSGGGR